MKLFDLVGAAVVAIWVVAGAMYVYRTEAPPSEASPNPTGGFAMEAGQSWLLLRRADEEVGFVHQTRTELDDGWLLEYDLLMTIDLLGAKRAIEARLKSRLDRKGFLDEFQTNVQASGQPFSARGHLDGTTLRMTIDLGQGPLSKTVQLDQKPRLAASAFSQLLAADPLAVGDTISGRYFDPTTMQITEQVMTYQGEKVIDLLGEQVASHHIVQQIAGDELDVYVDDAGNILIEEFPLEMIGSRVPPQMGRARASALRKRVDQLADRPQNPPGSPAGSSAPDVETFIELLGGQPDRTDFADPDEKKSPADAHR